MQPVLATITVGARPGTAVAGLGAVWVPNTGDGTVSKIDPSTNRAVATWRVGDAMAFYTKVCQPFGSVHSFMGTTFFVRRCDLPSALVTQANELWAAKNDTNSIIGLDPTNGHRGVTIPIGVTPFDLAADDASVWVTSYWDDAIVRVDTRSAKVVAVIRETGAGPSGMAVKDNTLWVANSRAGTVVRIDRQSNQVTATITLPCREPCPIGPTPLAIAATTDAVWVRNEASGTLARIDPTTNQVVATIDVGAFDGRAGLDGVAVTASTVWLTGVNLQRVDTRTTTVSGTFDLNAFTIGSGYGSLWVTDVRGRILRIDPQLAGAR
jgi:YVTN family beta-propeller protein